MTFAAVVRSTLVPVAVWAIAPVSAAPATSQPTAEQIKAEKAIAARNFIGAETAFNALVQARLPSSDHVGPDPVLDRLIAEVIAMNGTPADTIGLLERTLSDPQVHGAGHLRLLLATAYEDAGQIDRAERTYKLAATDATATVGDRAGSAIGQARLRMLVAPDEATAILRSTVPTSAERWEVDLQLARAERLAGHANEAEAALGRAWAEAPDAGPEAVAPARVAGDLMVEGGSGGDRARFLAMLAVDRANRAPNGGQDVLAAGAPVCGTSGITPDDFIVASYLRQAYPGHPRLSLVKASKAAVAVPFMQATTRNAGLVVPDGQAATVTLRCRTAPAEDYAVRGGVGNTILDWISRHGAYPILDTAEEDQGTLLAGMLADRERRYGTDSVMLVPVLLRMLPLAAIASSDQASRARLAALGHRVAAILAANRAPADFVLQARFNALSLDAAAQSTSPSAVLAEADALLSSAALNPDVTVDTLYTAVTSVAARSQVPSALKVRLLEQAVAVLRPRVPAGDARLNALGLRLTTARGGQGDAAAASATATQFGFAPDLCEVARPAVRFVSANINADDYPTDLIQSQMQGRTILEVDLAPTGVATRPRIVVADPPFAFDTIAIAKSATLTYEPAKTNGVPRTCRGQIQGVTWRLPY